jgi:hypothetical protein
MYGEDSNVKNTINNSLINITGQESASIILQDIQLT